VKSDEELIIGTDWQILGWSSHGGWDGRVLEREKTIHIGFWWKIWRKVTAWKT